MAATRLFPVMPQLLHREFVAEYADTTGLFFEGNVVTSKKTRDFFAGNNFYTTAANRMARGLFPEAVTGKDVVSCLTNPS